MNFETTRAEIDLVLQGINHGWIHAAHDISEGGLIVTLAEMCLESPFGVEVRLDRIESSLTPEGILFTESGGFVLEIDPDFKDRLFRLSETLGAWAVELGSVSDRDRLSIELGDKRIVDINLSDLLKPWQQGLRKALK